MLEQVEELQFQLVQLLVEVVHKTLVEVVEELMLKVSLIMIVVVLVVPVLS
jgi:hypothetical protein|tara:strand:+ start:525 stop:677 length:153 start_codon:yes stop_codon:yes gene_type:complete